MTTSIGRVAGVVTPPPPLADERDQEGSTLPPRPGGLLSRRRPEWTGLLARTSTAWEVMVQRERDWVSEKCHSILWDDVGVRIIVFSAPHSPSKYSFSRLHARKQRTSRPFYTAKARRSVQKPSSRRPSPCSGAAAAGRARPPVGHTEAASSATATSAASRATAPTCRPTRRRTSKTSPAALAWNAWSSRTRTSSRNKGYWNGPPATGASQGGGPGAASGSGPGRGNAPPPRNPTALQTPRPGSSFVSFRVPLSQQFSSLFPPP